MRMTKLGSVLAALAVTAGTATVLAAGPAQAATATKATLTINGHQKVTGAYGDLVGFLNATVTDTSGTPVDGGSTDLQQRTPGHAWKTVKTDTDSSFVDFGSYGSHAKGNVQYRLHYLGDATYAGSFSSPVTVGTLWKIHESTACPRACHLSGRLAPVSKHHKITVQVKHGGWKPFKVTHTDKKGKYRVNLPLTHKTTRYRLVIAGTKSILATQKVYVIRVV